MSVLRQCLHAGKQEPYGKNRKSLSLTTYEVFIELNRLNIIVQVTVHHYGPVACLINGARIVLKLRILHNEKLNGCQRSCSILHEMQIHFGFTRQKDAFLNKATKNIDANT